MLTICCFQWYMLLKLYKLQLISCRWVTYCIVNTDCEKLEWLWLLILRAGYTWCEHICILYNNNKILFCCLHFSIKQLCSFFFSERFGKIQDIQEENDLPVSSIKCWCMYIYVYLWNNKNKINNHNSFFTFSSKYLKYMFTGLSVAAQHLYTILWHACV